MTNRKLIERLAHALSVHHAILLAQGVLLQRLSVSKQEYADAVKKCRPNAAAYKSKLLASFLRALRSLKKTYGNPGLRRSLASVSTRGKGPKVLAISSTFQNNFTLSHCIYSPKRGWGS